MRTEYKKPAISFKEQLERLKERGLIIEDDNRTLHYLSNINYYRLSAYWYPFIQDKEKEIFKTDSYFQNVLDIYNFDRELRLIFYDAIERIEISIRTQFTYKLSHRYNPFWIENPNIYNDENRYLQDLGKVKEEIKRSEELFLHRFKEKYLNEIPPSWIATEVISFGLLSSFFKNLKDKNIKEQIADFYLLTCPVFESWLHNLIYVRNICAHHSRLWNREFRIKPLLPHKKHKIFSINNFSNIRVYIAVCIVLYFLSIINPTSHFKKKLFELIDRYPSVDLAPMGFPVNWKEEKLFKIEE